MNKIKQLVIDPAVNLVAAHRAKSKVTAWYLHVKILKSVCPYVQCAPKCLEKVCIIGKDVKKMLYTRV